ncbi:protein Hol1p [[Candida] anglica]|uniref:Protein Hol1p n=1 Tax=[Candida] anglica TaxID=148631 RepID=A0ABP0EIE9_9ASCO
MNSYKGRKPPTSTANVNLSIPTENKRKNMEKQNLDKVLLGERLSIDEEMVPGTIHLIDLEGVLNVKKDSGSQSNIILQPQPSSNPNDPLRWPKSKKIAQFSLLWLWSFVQGAGINWAGPLFTIWTEEFNCTFAQLNIAAAICFAFLGIGSVFLQPTAMKLGRRFVYLASTFVVIISNIIGSQGNSVQILYVVNFLSGFATAPGDTLVEISTTDVFFQHERASYLSWFVLSLYAGSDLGPVASGYIVQNLHWRWCYYIQVIISGVILILQLFFMEDTTFERRETEELEDTIMQQIKSRETILSAVQSGQLSQARVNSDDKLNAIVSVNNSINTDDDSIDYSIPKRTYWQKMRLVETEYNDSRSWLTIFYRPFFLFTIPAVMWGGLVYGSQMMWLSLLATTQSQIFSVAPYNFTTPQVGLTNIGALVGSLIGMAYGGPFVDWVTIKLSIRNNGIMEPEFRLWTMIVPTILNAAGLLAYGLGVSYETHWFIPAGLGQGFLGFSMASSGAICLTYSIDSYPKLASEGLVLMLLLRNLIGCGFTFAIQPWLNKSGLKLTTWLMFMLSLVINGSFVIMIKWGKDFRRATKDSYYKYSDPMFGELFKK